jgi:UV DNA damage repair endonuclease
MTETLQVERQTAGEKQRYVRVQVHFHPDDFSIVEKLREQVGARSLPILIRDALALYRWWVGVKQEGYRIQIVKPGEAPIQPVLIFGNNP